VGHPRDGARQSPCDWDEGIRPVAVSLSASAAGSGDD